MRSVLRLAQFQRLFSAEHLWHLLPGILGLVGVDSLHVYVLLEVFCILMYSRVFALLIFQKKLEKLLKQKDVKILLAQKDYQLQTLELYQANETIQKLQLDNRACSEKVGCVFRITIAVAMILCCSSRCEVVPSSGRKFC